MPEHRLLPSFWLVLFTILLLQPQQELPRTEEAPLRDEVSTHEGLRDVCQVLIVRDLGNDGLLMLAASRPGRCPQPDVKLRDGRGHHVHRERIPDEPCKLFARQHVDHLLEDLLVMAAWHPGVSRDRGEQAQHLAADGPVCVEGQVLEARTRHGECGLQHQRAQHREDRSVLEGRQLEVVQAVPSVKDRHQPKWSICNNHLGERAGARLENVAHHSIPVHDRRRAVRRLQCLPIRIVFLCAFQKHLVQPPLMLFLNYPLHLGPSEAHVVAWSLRDEPYEEARSGQSLRDLRSLGPRVREHLVQRGLVVAADELLWVLIPLHLGLLAGLDLPTLLLPPHALRLEAGHAVVFRAPAPLQRQPEVQALLLLRRWCQQDAVARSERPGRHVSQLDSKQTHLRGPLDGQAQVHVVEGVEGQDLLFATVLYLHPRLPLLARLLPLHITPCLVVAPGAQVLRVCPSLAQAAIGGLLILLYPWAVSIFLRGHDHRLASGRLQQRRPQLLCNLRLGSVRRRKHDGLVVFRQQAKLAIVLQSLLHDVPLRVLRRGGPLRAQLGLHGSQLAG
mmetsp:Transcript_10425/g.36585  ORF Transcript_10425/g.36585 Transcript_10425/m.36585 type:complete len:561 (-) Transcript_10425:1428-3110(-)